jgi:hypothetical protein
LFLVQALVSELASVLAHCNLQDLLSHWMPRSFAWPRFLEGDNHHQTRKKSNGSQLFWHIVFGTHRLKTPHCAPVQTRR